MVQLTALYVAISGLVAATSLAAASSSQWFETDGGRIRLVAGEANPGAKAIQGVLQVQLQPGWKTYWRDPGGSGVPPRIDVSQTPGITGAEIGFPPPHRFDDPYGSWVGYKTSTDFAVTYSTDPENLPSVLQASIFLGICKEICIPVQTDLSVPLDKGPADPADVSLIKAVFTSLPRPASAEFGVTGAILEGNSNLVVTARLPDAGKSPALFIENLGGWYFGDPQIISQDNDGVRFSMKILEAPDKTGDSFSLPYTLVTASGSVQGNLAVETASK
jgi:DsbC/DsbD-like thiol-disulfide interchange protein